MTYSYVQISIHIIVLVLIFPKNVSSYKKDNIVDHKLMENLAENVWNLDGQAKALFTAQICTIANRKVTDGQLTTELEQLKMDLSGYCGAQNNALEKREKLEKMQENVKKLLSSADWAKNMKNSLKSAQIEFEEMAAKNDGKIQMALKEEGEILKKIEHGMPSKGENIPKWFRSELANALDVDQNGQISVKGLFGLLDTIFDKFFVDKNGFAHQMLYGTQGQGNGHHHHHNRASAHAQFGSVRVKRADDMPDFFTGVGLTLVLLAFVVIFASVLFPLVVIFCVGGALWMAIMGDH